MIKSSTALWQTAKSNHDSNITKNPYKINIIKTRTIFSYFCMEWLQLNRNRVKISTYVKYSNIVKKYIIARLGGYSIKNISTIKIEEFSNELLNENELSPKTVKDILTVLNSIIKYTDKAYSLKLSNIDIISPKVPKKEMRVLNIEEQTKLVNYLLSDLDIYKFGVLLSLLTGIRIGELCALKWKNISFTDKTIIIDSTLSRLQNTNFAKESKTQIIITEPKSVSSSRSIPLTDNAMKLCKRFYCNNLEAFVLSGDSITVVEPRTMQYKLSRYVKDCGLKDVHFHTLRHTFATRCVEVDFEIKTLSEILGHSSPKITLDRYVHTSMQLKRTNMNKLSGLGF